MLNEITRFFASDSFIPHGHCFMWTPSILYTWVISDITIFLSYSAIPLALMYIMRKRTDIPFNGLVILFAAFILCCGITHAMGAWTIWNPQYGLASLFKAVTAAVSLATAAVLWPLAPTLIAIPSFSDLQNANRKLEKTTDELRMANQHLEQFATMASHDLRSPLTSIINLSDLAMLESQGADNQPLRRIREMAEKMEAVIAGYRRLSHLRLDSSTLERLKVSDLIAAARKEVTSPLEVTLTGNADVVADKVLFSQLFVNLLGNAAHHASQPAVSIHCERRAAEVWIEVANPIDGTLTIDDTIFAPFRRLTTRGDGMGLGLAICDRIVQLHGGTIHASSDNGRFAIRFSVPREPQAGFTA